MGLESLARFARSGWSRSPLAGLVPHAPRPFVELLGAGPIILGHRGAAGLAPENTLAAMQRAVNLGFGFEIDVQRCRTGEVVVMHDEDVRRTTDGRGEVASMSLFELRSLDAGGGERIPTLDEVLEAHGGEVPIDIELKSVEPRAPLVTAVLEALRRHRRVDDVFVTSFDPLILEQCRLQEPRLCRGQIFGTFDDASIPWYQKIALRNLLLNRRAEPDLLAIEFTMLDWPYARLLRSLGYPVLAWTPNEPDDLEAMDDLGVGVITDHPQRV